MCNEKEEQSVITDKVDLKEKIEALIESSDLCYGDVAYALNALKASYMEKGNNLLNSESIQKVIETPRFKG